MQARREGTSQFVLSFPIDYLRKKKDSSQLDFFFTRMYSKAGLDDEHLSVTIII